MSVAAYCLIAFMCGGTLGFVIGHQLASPRSMTWTNIKWSSNHWEVKGSCLFSPIGRHFFQKEIPSPRQCYWCKEMETIKL